MKAKPRRAKPTVRTGKRPAVTRRASSGPRPARRQSGPSRADTAPGDDQPMASPKRLLRAGLSALSIPGAESAMADGLSKLADSFGFKKLESVFDHRVAAALERIGFPSAAELRRLVDGADAMPPRRQARKARTRR
ncbi:MAG: hypothetical protein QOG17_189 [Gammaproteobacteria bacterium]|jgi:hypothetical protein|nr:hypothetical protein [Gammaproteobacteria bacterium]